jgi:Uma2 family endonuclease
MDTTTKQDPAWERAMRDPSLKDVPYKIETNERGQLVLSPPEPYHSRGQGRIQDLLRDRMPREGEQPPEFPIYTSKGVKLPDVVWISAERLADLPDDAPASPVAPEICVEVLSALNTQPEIEEKRRLYFEAGAEEVWVCDLDREMTFYDADGEIPRSRLVPDFPPSIADASTG